MSAGARVGLLGGTLDPIHVGHLETACAAQRAVHLEHVYFLPSGVPPHRTQQPFASSHHRFAMSALAINGVEGLRVSDIELSAPGPSYTVDTLARFSNATGFRTSQIFFITGADAFAEIETWHRYPEVLDLANFVVISRPAFDLASLPKRLPGLADRMIEPGAEHTASGRCAIFLVGASTPDVSSTDIRRRLTTGQSIAGLVPASVESHIRQHGLYSHHGRSLA
jgi:nicotinate-nucleotide adenylyltransferase